MAERMFEVLEDQKYTGKHRVYVAGQKFPESELLGNDENHRMALEGKGDKEPKIKLVRAKRKKAAKKKADEGDGNNGDDGADDQ